MIFPSIFIILSVPVKCRNKARDYLKNLGYQLIVGDIKNNGHAFEDWYVDPNVIKYDIWKEYINNDITHSEIKFNLKDL